MKNIQYSYIITLFLCLFTASVSAQIFPNVTPDNIDETVDLIFELHGNIIDNDYTTVHSFLEGMLPSSSNDPSYDSLCTPPDATIDSADSNSISASWNPITGIHSYQTAFMKLNNFLPTGPETGSATVTNTNIQFSVSNGLILMVFKTHCTSLTSGKLSIIIVDKPIFFNVLTRDCNCSYPRLPIETKPFGADDGVAIFYYTHEGSTGYYQGNITFEGDDEDANAQFLIKIEFLESGEIIISKRSDCMINLFNEPAGSILYNQEDDDEDGEIMGSLTFSSGLVFSPTLDRVGTFTISECLSDPEIYDKLITPFDHPNILNMQEGTLNVIPNPAKELVSISLPDNFQSEEYSFLILDATGKEIRLPSNFYHFADRVVDIQIGQLPLGIYTFVFHSKEKIMKARFVKIN